MSTETIITLIGIVTGSSWLGQLILEVYKSHRKKRTPLEELTLAIGRRNLLELCKKYLKHGSIPEDEYEAFTKLGEAYLKMGGNSRVKKLYQECLALPLQSC